jgi:hypothetical protein
MNPTVELVLKHKKANMRKSGLLMLQALKSAPHLNDITAWPDTTLDEMSAFIFNEGGGLYSRQAISQ